MKKRYGVSAPLTGAFEVVNARSKAGARIEFAEKQSLRGADRSCIIDINVHPIDRKMKPARVFVRDKRTGELRTEIVDKPVQSIQFAIASRERELIREHMRDLANRCPKCGNIRALNGVCDFCD